MIRPNLEEAKQLSKGYTIIPIALEIFSDLKTPIELLKKLRGQSDSWYILESVNGGNSWGRYTFLGYQPVLSIRGTKNTVMIKKGSSETTSHTDAVKVLRDLIAQYKSPRIPYLPPFTGGFVGYFAYDFVQHFIPGLTLQARDTEGFLDFHLMMMDKVIAFDHLRQKIYLIANIKTAENEYQETLNKAKAMMDALKDSGEVY